MSDDGIKLPRSSYDELVKIIKGYGRLKEPASLDEVSSISTVNKSAVSANNSFLASVGVIEGGKAKKITDRGRELAQALEHGIPEPIEENWSKVVRADEFLNKMAIAVRIRGQIETSALESHIAYSAGEAKQKKVMTGARAVIDILRAAGVVREENGQIVASESKPELRESLESDEMAGDSNSQKEQVRTSFIRETDGAIQFSIVLQINAKPNELAGLGEKLRGLISDIRDGINDRDSATISVDNHDIDSE